MTTEINKEGSAQLAENGSAVQTDVKSESHEDKVAYETYRRVISQKKKRDEEVEHLRAELAKRDQEALMAEGKKDEAYAKAMEALTQKNIELEETRKKYATSVISEQIKSKAAQLGCLNAETLMAVGDFSEVQVDDNYRVDTTDLERALENAQKQHSYLFQKTVSAPRDGVPFSGSKLVTSKPVSEMSQKEIMDRLRSMEQQEKRNR